MFCKNCGNENHKGSIYCKQCGIKITHSEMSDVNINHSLGHSIDQHTPPYPYVISTWKFIIMSLATLGIFEIYWFYKQWKSFNSENKLDHNSISLWILALFSPLSSYNLFKHVSNNIIEKNQGKGVEAGLLAIIYFFFARFFLGFLPLIPVQNKINFYWEKKYRNKLVRSKFSLWNWIIVIAIAVILYSAFYSEDNTNSISNIPETTVIERDTQEEIASSVVNIFCPSTLDNEESSGGSGIILTEDGIVLTNSHIIPQDENELFVDESGCIVVLPNPTTGQPLEIYWATPVVLHGISEDYDLAYMMIYDAYFNEETNEYEGAYPRTFPAFDDTSRCSNENLKLGEPVRIYGYPAISGGYSLTITDGIVSSFPEDGLIITSAKISYGNSGGLAVDEKGCMIGVPTLVSSDENESLGVIYSMDLVRDFSSEVEQYLSELE